MGAPKRCILDAATDPTERQRILTMLLSRLVTSDTVAPGMKTPCRLWVGADDGKGYGKFKYKQVTYYTHRSIRELRTGIRIARSMVLDHKCQNKGCSFDPNDTDTHLEEVTYKVNTWRAGMLDNPRCAKTGRYYNADPNSESPTAVPAGPVFADHEFA